MSTRIPPASKQVHLKLCHRIIFLDSFLQTPWNIDMEPFKRKTYLPTVNLPPIPIPTPSYPKDPKTIGLSKKDKYHTMPGSRLPLQWALLSAQFGDEPGTRNSNLLEFYHIQIIYVQNIYSSFACNYRSSVSGTSHLQTESKPNPQPKRTKSDLGPYRIQGCLWWSLKPLCVWWCLMYHVPQPWWNQWDTPNYMPR